MISNHYRSYCRIPGESIKMSSQEAPAPNNCEVCGQQFNNTEELHKHKTEAHKGENKNNQEQQTQ